MEVSQELKLFLGHSALFHLETGTLETEQILRLGLSGPAAHREETLACRPPHPVISGTWPTRVQRNFVLCS